MQHSRVLRKQKSERSCHEGDSQQLREAHCQKGTNKSWLWLWQTSNLYVFHLRQDYVMYSLYLCAVLALRI